MKIEVVEDGKLITYKRTGRCMACGECCRRTIRYEWSVQKGIYAEEGEKPEEYDYSEMEGGSYIWYYGVWWYFRTVEVGELKETSLCPHWDAEEHCCAEHSNPQERRSICHFWPYHPDDLKHFPKCGYKFERIGPKDE